MKRIYFALIALVTLFSACSGDSYNSLAEGESLIPAKKGINFRGSMTGASRATETAFEIGDHISVFAVRPSDNIKLELEGNYADNVRYTCYGSYFDTADPITLPENDTKGLAYYAIYPYYHGMTNAFVFVVNEDQTRHSSYTKSDLCTAFCAPTTAKTVNLEFNHRLSNVVVKFSGDNIANKNIQAELNNVLVSCKVDINANTYEGIGEKYTVIMGKESTNTFHAIIPPQTTYKDQVFMTITLNGEEYELSLASDLSFNSGKQIVFDIEVTDTAIRDLNGYLTPWEEEDPRFNEVVPEEIEEKLDDHMPIYTGVNPPIIEGAYYLNPFVAVYCEDGGFEPGYEVMSEYIRFSNQNTANNTLDMAEYSEYGNGHLEGSGAFISGSGNNFTAFFNTNGTDTGEEGNTVTFKTALVISGTKASDGIKDLYYAVVMVEKNGDYYDDFMKEGIFRVFKDQDGLSVKTSWNGYSLSRGVVQGLLNSMLANIKK